MSAANRRVQTFRTRRFAALITRRGWVLTRSDSKYAIVVKTWKWDRILETMHQRKATEGFIRAETPVLYVIDGDCRHAD